MKPESKTTLKGKLCFYVKVLMNNFKHSSILVAKYL